METHARTVAHPARSIVAAALLLLAVGWVVAAGHAASGAQVHVRSTSLGKILVDSTGRTLYMFAPDKRSQSVCYGACASYWPPLTSKTTHVTGVGIKASLLTTSKRRDGSLQVTYNGHPLYRYVGDAKAGQTKGEGQNVSGGLWWAVSPAGKAVKKSSAGSSGGGGGYGSGGGGYGG